MEEELKEYLRKVHGATEKSIARIEKNATEEELDVLRKGMQSMASQWQQEQKAAKEKAQRKVRQQAREKRVRKKSQFAMGFGIILLVMLTAMLLKPVFNPPRDTQAEQKNAAQIVSEWLEEDAVSRDYIIYELMSRGFTREESQYAADNCGADWYEQAVRAAEDYMSQGQHTQEELQTMLQQKKFSYAQILHALESFK